MTASLDFKAFWRPDIAAPEDGRTPARLDNTPNRCARRFAVRRSLFSTVEEFR